MTGNILLIEDEEKIARFMELELKYEGFDVAIASDGEEGYKRFLNEKFDLIILDLMLPKLNGLELCKKIKKTSDIPIIMVTAKSDVADIVNGFEIGADDYLTKPFNMEELIARIKRFLKNKKDLNIMIVNNLTLNENTREVFIKDVKINLSKTEFDLLQFLMVNSNLVLTREKILNGVWGYDSDTNENIVDVYIKYLRDKLLDKENQLIKTVRGVGYVLKKNN